MRARSTPVSKSGQSQGTEARGEVGGCAGRAALFGGAPRSWRRRLQRWAKSGLGAGDFAEQGGRAPAGPPTPEEASPPTLPMVATSKSCTDPKLDSWPFARDFAARRLGRVASPDVRLRRSRVRQAPGPAASDAGDLERLSFD
jgi:hypothetical protein